MGFEKGPQIPPPEKEKGGVERLRELRENLQEVKRVIDSQIDELVQKLSLVIASAEEESIKKGKPGEVIREILESQNINKEIDELKNAVKRLQSFIDQIGSTR